MAYIGNTGTTQTFTPSIDYFSGNGSTTAFTLSRPVASVAQIQVTINNVAQNPSSAYTVNGSTLTFTSAPLSGSSNIYVYYTSPNTQIIQPGQNTVAPSSLTTTNALYWDASGNVGIGTASPSYQLTMSKAGQNYISISNTTNTLTSYMGVDTTGVVIQSAGAYPIKFLPNNTEAMRIDSSGNLMLNTTSASGKFTIVDNTGGAGVATTVTLTNGVDANCYLSLTGSSATDKRVVIGPSTGTAVAFQTNATERMRISAGGVVLIGATAVSAAETLKVTGAALDRVVHFENTNNTSGAQVIRTLMGTNASNTSSYHMVCTANGDKLYIYGNGNVVNVNNSYGALSDIKLKENIVDATSKLADLMQVKVRNYNLIGDTTKQIGVVAQELETVFPAMVDESPDRDGEGGNLSTVTKSVKYSVFVPILIKAIQEQQALITEQQAMLASLTTRVKALETT